MLTLRTSIGVCILTLFASTAMAGDMYVYPKKEQSQDQQMKDQGECNRWAIGETGFDPAAPPTATTAPPKSSAKKGGMLRGAARGALLGEIIDDDAGKGAAAGAAIGGMRRRDQQRQEQTATQQWEQDEAAKYQARRNEYNRAYKVCLEARDYSVN